ncbi:hypothetical protein GUJ93_ZPchr0006g42029 [Zizania palustris]|uniref:TPX2 C-terminal domain-containing protein n=1 Tax=Zizania palustris TaxID=103762 RepID=A0A8J5STG0_ZIZPA|nr:hypothetical protein GUJ93_ZPchr0006g42029 [Zizania palustris]
MLQFNKWYLIMDQYHLVGLLRSRCHGKKRSVFEHNRRQEELSNLTLPGLVAQKKAFFEEYYKRARRLKAQEAINQAAATLDEGSDHNTLGHDSQEEPELPAVNSEEPVASAPSSSFEPSTGLNSSDERKCQNSHGLGYLTFNPLFSQITGTQNVQQDKGTISGQKQPADGNFPCPTYTNTRHVLNREPLERKVLAPKHVVSDDNGENCFVSRIVLPVASLQSECVKFDIEKPGPRKNVVITSRATKRSKESSTSLIHIPRIDSRRNSENKTSQDSKDPFHKRVEMKFRALSDRMNADRAAASSRSASYQHADKAVTSCRSSSYQNAVRFATSSRSALCQNAGRVCTSSKSAPQVSHKSLTEAPHAHTHPHAIFVNNGSHVSLNNISATEKVAAKHLVMVHSSKNANTFRTAQVQVASKRASGLSSVSNGMHNKRKQLSTPSTWDENKLNRGYPRMSAPSSTRSSSDSILPYKTVKAPKISNGTNVVVKRTEIVQKPANGSHLAGGRNVQPNHSVNFSEQKRKVISSHTSNVSSSVRNNLTCGPSLSKSKPRQEKPRWR